MEWRRLVAPFIVLSAALWGFLFFARAASLPSSVTAVPSATVAAQADYDWYANVDALTPTTPLAAVDATSTVPSPGSTIRLRMGVGDTGLPLPAGTTFFLQYANATAGPWTDLSTSTAWTFFDNPSVSDGQVIITTLLPASTVGESYGESNPSAAMPLQLLSGDFGEWDWVLFNNTADTSTDWFFRMIYASGTTLSSYNNYPELTAVPAGGGGGGGGSGSVIGVGGGGSLYNNPTNNQTSSGNVPTQPPLVPPLYQCIDFNGDGVVDIVDLSILLYYYGGPIPPGTPISCLAALTHNDTVDFADISILMYYWTG